MLKHLAIMILTISALPVWASSIEGVGLVLRQDKHSITHIDDVILGAPADRAGFKSGEVLVRIDGKDVTKLSLKKIVTLIRGPVGTPVVLGVSEKDSLSTRDVSLLREKFSVEDNCFLEGSILLRADPFIPGLPPSGISGRIGRQYLNLAVNGSMVYGYIKGEPVHLNFFLNGTWTTVMGFIHGRPIQWNGSNGNFYGYQSCIP